MENAFYIDGKLKKENEGTLPPVAWAEINLDAIASNMKAIRRITPETAEIMSVVKANAYGHGATAVSKTAIANGASMLAVARLEEALELRQAGIEAPILMLGCCLTEYVSVMADMDIRTSINSFTEAKAFSEQACRLGKRLKCHIKIDTGMGRLGIAADGLPVTESRTAFEQVRNICGLNGLYVEGIFTHFAKADSADKASAEEQLRRFASLVKQTDEAGLSIRLRHGANSAAVLEMPNACFNLVRPGIALYGLAPSEEISFQGLIPAMSLRSRIIGIKKTGVGFGVSYGGTFVAKRPSVIAAVALGYADGYRRALSNRSCMLVRGMRAPVAGRVCMDITMLDVTDIPGVGLGDEVTALGKQGREEISADELAGLLDTISYEIVSAISSRVRRVYIGG